MSRQLHSLGCGCLLTDAGAGAQQLSAASISKGFKETLAKLFGKAVNFSLSLPILSPRMGEQRAQHQKAAADSAAELLVAAASAAAKSSGAANSRSGSMPVMSAKAPATDCAQLYPCL